MNELAEKKPQNTFQVLQTAKTEFSNVCVDKRMKWETEFRFAVQHLQKNDFLNNVAFNNQNSLRNAIVNVAAIGISLNPASKHAYLVPRKGVVCLDISYMGLLHLACSTGSLEWGQAKIVRANDTYENAGIDKAPNHIYQAFGNVEARGPIVGAYCTVKTNSGDYLTEEMDIDSIFDIRGRSEAFKSGHGPWITDEEQMIKKTVVKRASSYWPTVERFDKAVTMLNEDNGEGIDFDKEKEPEDKRTRPGRNKNLLPAALRQVVDNVKEALEAEDYESVVDVFLGFDEHEEQIAVQKCFDSKERKAIKTYMDAIENLPERKANTQKMTYLNEKELEVLADYNWNGRKSAIMDAPKVVNQ